MGQQANVHSHSNLNQPITLLDENVHRERVHEDMEEVEMEEEEEEDDDDIDM